VLDLVVHASGSCGVLNFLIRTKFMVFLGSALRSFYLSHFSSTPALPFSIYLLFSYDCAALKYFNTKSHLG